MKIDEKIGEINPRYKNAVWEHKIVYDSTSDQLEPIYFWILDFMKEKLTPNVEKLEDNFAASPGGGFFSEMGAKTTKMQEEGMKIMGTINTLIRTIINLIYDLKDFEIRLKQYDNLQDKESKTAEAAQLSLKNVWLDKVDMPMRGRGSIHQMTYELGFTTLRDAFLAVKSISDVDKLDLNDRVKRVLKPRLAEYYAWQERSEQELRKRFEIEKSYLKSEVSALKLYTRWAKPYLQNAEELRMRAGTSNKKTGKITDPEIVNAFNTMILDLKILGTKEHKPIDLAREREIPREFENEKFKRTYYSCVLVHFKFRGLPYRTPQGHYVFGGRAEITMKGYALNSDELEVLRKEIDKDDLVTALNLVQDTTESSLKQLQEDLEHFIEEKPKEEKKEEEKKKDELQIGKIKKDNYKEGIFRKYIEQSVANTVFILYDTYKKAHGMPTFTKPEWGTDEVKTVFTRKN
jgi:hypothetical protein